MMSKGSPLNLLFYNQQHFHGKQVMRGSERSYFIKFSLLQNLVKVFYFYLIKKYLLKGSLLKKTVNVSFGSTIKLFRKLVEVIVISKAGHIGVKV